MLLPVDTISPRLVSSLWSSVPGAIATGSANQPIDGLSRADPVAIPPGTDLNTNDKPVPQVDAGDGFSTRRVSGWMAGHAKIDQNMADSSRGRHPPEMLTVARASRRLIRLLGSQEFPQHPVVTSLAHREC